MITVSGKCMCPSCEARTGNVYRMIGVCYNCGAEPILMIFRAGDAKRALDCPVCGCWSRVNAKRLASDDEIPDAVSSPREGGGK